MQPPQLDDDDEDFVPQIPVLNLKSSPTASENIINAENLQNVVDFKILKIAIMCSLDYKNISNIGKVMLQEIYPVIKENGYTKIELICGGGAGGDGIIRNLAEQFKWTLKIIPTEFSKYKRQAYFERNKVILDNNPNIIITFTTKRVDYITNFLTLSRKKDQTNIIKILEYT